MPPLVPEDFDKNVFINCPFDQEYLSLLRPLLFTILYVGFNPKIGLESSDSGETSKKQFLMGNPRMLRDSVLNKKEDVTFRLRPLIKIYRLVATSA